MARKGITHGRPPAGQPCGECGQHHVTRYDHPACMGHVRFVTDPESPDYRARLPQPRPCLSYPRPGGERCSKHGGGSPAAKAAADKRQAEEKARAAVLAKLGDTGDPVTDPIGQLCRIAGRGIAFMEALGHRVDALDDTADPDRARADIAVYGRAIKDAAQIVESIIRMGIAERLAKADAEQTAAIVAFIDAVLTDLGHNPRDPEVAGAVTRRLELVS